MKIMLIGAGGFGKEHLAALAEIGSLSLAVAEMREDTLDEVRSRFALADWDRDAGTLADRFRPDGAIVAAPAAANAALAEIMLRRDIPVLVEKPVAPDAAAMRRLCAVAAQSAAFLQPGHILRFSAAHRAMAATLASGELGELLHVESRRCRDADHARRYAATDPVLMTMIHDIDLALWLDRGGRAISAVASRHPANTFRSLTSARIESSTGVTWHVATAWLHTGAQCPPDRVEIVGSKGSAELVVGSHLEVFAGPGRRIADDPAADPLRAELDCFLAGVRSGASTAPVTPQDALNGLIAAEMVLQAMARA